MLSPGQAEACLAPVGLSGTERHGELDKDSLGQVEEQTFAWPGVRREQGTRTYP